MLFLIFIFIVGILFYIVKTYNHLKQLAERVFEAFANILVSMQKRADLANKLQEIASTYAKDEQFTMIAIPSMEHSGKVVEAYTASLTAVSAVTAAAQRFPNLKADGLYKNLMNQLAGIEHGLQTKRETYNACVRAYNSPLKQLPTVLYAPALGLGEAPYWQSDDPESLGKLKEFKTDDERVRAMAANLGKGVKDGASAVSSGVRAKVEQSRTSASKPENTEEIAPASTSNEQTPPAPKT